MIITINEFKTQLIKEGLFSWFTQDQHEQIGSNINNNITVYMHDNKGNVWKEDSYEGYGVFGGKDYFVLLAEMNGYNNNDRQEGIDLQYNKKITRNEDGILLYPALISNPDYDISKHDFSIPATDDPNQGGLYIDEEEDYEDYEEDYDEEFNENFNENKGLLAFVYKDSLGDTTNNGVSSKIDQFICIGENISGPVNVDNSDKSNVLVIIKKTIMNKTHLRAIPYDFYVHGTHSMFGGNFIYTSDSRFPSNTPIKIFDRIE